MAIKIPKKIREEKAKEERADLQKKKKKELYEAKE